MKNIFKIFKISKPQHKWIAVACVLITIQAILQQASPVTLKYVIDELSKQIPPRAILQNKPILILNEATSSLDSKSEHLVQDTPQKLAKKPGLYSELLKYQIDGNKKLLSKYELR